MPGAFGKENLSVIHSRGRNQFVKQFTDPDKSDVKQITKILFEVETAKESFWGGGTHVSLKDEVSSVAIEVDGVYFPLKRYEHITLDEQLKNLLSEFEYEGGALQGIGSVEHAGIYRFKVSDGKAAAREGPLADAESTAAVRVSCVVQVGGKRRSKKRRTKKRRTKKRRTKKRRTSARKSRRR